MSIAFEILASPTDVSRRASETMAGLIDASPECTLGLATGSSPVETYQLLVEKHQNGLSFSQAASFNLDEYVGLAPDHPQSYHAFMAEHLFDHVDLAPDRIHIPKGDADDLDAECDRFEAAIDEAGGVDLWLLGIGSNGHIGFNEPGSPNDSRTRIVDLAPETVQANSRFFETADDVPRQALTAGIATILSARRILLLACGDHKAEAICEALAGPVSADCPASFLQEHPDCTFLLDRAAASLLTP